MWVDYLRRCYFNDSLHQSSISFIEVSLEDHLHYNNFEDFVLTTMSYIASLRWYCTLQTMWMLASLTTN